MRAKKEVITAASVFSMGPADRPVEGRRGDSIGYIHVLLVLKLFKGGSTFSSTSLSTCKRAIKVLNSG